MAFAVLNGTSYQVYTPAEPTDDTEEDEDDQSKSCQENIDRGTAVCAWISRVFEDGVIADIGIPPDIHSGRSGEARVTRALMAVAGSRDTPPSREPPPNSALVIHSRGSRHGIHRAVRVRMDTSTTRYVRIWGLALGVRGQVLNAVTFLFELRRRRRGAGLESFRLIEQPNGQAPLDPRPRKPGR
ncbi:MAG: hypothetical protein JNL94_12765 [Planctomycetes bacterium]|nr:hypothetical protein [Planctomycetota bacterium]